MATLRLSSQCIEAALKRGLGASFRTIRAGVENGKAFISVTKFITFTFKLWCDEPTAGRRLTIHYSGSLGSDIILALAKSRIMRALPFVEKIQGGECVIDLEMIEAAGERLCDWAEVTAVQMPDGVETFCRIDFAIKENGTCPS